MSKKKYLKDSKGLARAVTTDTLQLEKPLSNENYDINVHNRNMDKIDKAINDVKGSIDGLELTASNVTISDVDNKFTSTDVEGALKEAIDKIDENKTSIQNAQNDIQNLQTELGNNKTVLEANINAIREVL